MTSVLHHHAKLNTKLGNDYTGSFMPESPHQTSTHKLSAYERLLEELRKIGSVHEVTTIEEFLKDAGDPGTTSHILLFPKPVAEGVWPIYDSKGKIGAVYSEKMNRIIVSGNKYNRDTTPWEIRDETLRTGIDEIASIYGCPKLSVTQKELEEYIKRCAKH